MNLYTVDWKDWTGPGPRLNDIVGQDQAVSCLRAFAQLHESSETAPGHILLVGPQGMGQMLIAAGFAAGFGANSMAMAKGPEFEEQADLTRCLTNLIERQFLLIRDVHLIRKPIWEKLPSAMRSNSLTITIGEGPAARDHVMEIRPFTMIATCPAVRDCPEELLAGFSLVVSLQPYSKTELSEIANRIARKIDVSLEPGANELLAGGCNGTPGHLEELMRRLARITGHSQITEDDVSRIPRLKNIVGQEQAVSRLRAFAQLHDSSGTAPGHILLIGPEEMGQTFIATALAEEFWVGFQTVKCSEIEASGDLTAIFTNLRERQFLLIKGLQNLRKFSWNLLCSALRTYQLTITIGQGPAARNHVMEIRPFTMIATCPKVRDCPPELLAEFSLVLSLEPYSKAELAEIANRIARKLDVSLEPGANELLAGGCNGSPGHLELIMRRLVRTMGQNNITSDAVRTGFQALGIRVASPASAFESTDLQELSGVEFERLIATLLGKMGFETEMTKTSGDGGIDVIANLSRAIVGGRYLFQCKRYAPNNLIGAPMLRDFYGAVTADRAVKGVFITTSDFTAQAREFGEKVGLELIGQAQLQELIGELRPSDKPANQ